MRSTSPSMTLTVSEGLAARSRGPDARDDRLRAVKVKAFAINEERRPIAARFQLASVRIDFKEVHCRRADEGGDELTVRPVEDFAWRADLFDQAVAQKDNAVGERHRLELVMSDIDRRRFESLMQPGDLDAHMVAQRGVEVRERFVEQKHTRGLDDGASDRDTLLLAARKPIDLRSRNWSSPSVAAAALMRRSISSGAIFMRLRPNAMLSRTDICG